MEPCAKYTAPRTSRRRAEARVSVAIAAASRARKPADGRTGASDRATINPRWSATYRASHCGQASRCARASPAEPARDASSANAMWRLRNSWQSIGREWDTFGTRRRRLGSVPRCPPLTRNAAATYRSAGSTMSANEFRARFSRDFTVPRLQCVISAISSYERPSSSRSTNTSR